VPWLILVVVFIQQERILNQEAGPGRRHIAHHTHLA
jgi:hypothetical protein